MVFLRTVAIVASSHVIIGAIWIALIFSLSDLGSINHYPVSLSLGGVMFISLNIGLFIYFPERITRLLCLGLIFISVYYCYQISSEWRYAQKLIDYHRNNYTREWYCELTYRDKLLIESHTTHGVEDCRS
jgi:hypothetical protein